MVQLEQLFRPRSIAVIGASRQEKSIGYQLIHNLIIYKFTGSIYPVNKAAETVHSIKAYKSVLDIPYEVDMAIIIVPADQVLTVMEECGKKGIKSAVVISAGFKEIGSVGEEREKKLHALIQKYGIRMIGPNCMGIINTAEDIRLNGTFAKTEPLKGRIAMMSQSGALGEAILSYARNINIGFSKFVSLGNKTDISGNDLLREWENDDATDIILMYIENFGNPRNFSRIAKRLTKKKPVIVLKSGRSEAGARAAKSHTGVLAGLDIAVDALLEQCGVIRVQSMEELFDLATAFLAQPLPLGENVAIVTNAGGPGILAVDALVSYNMNIAKFGDETLKKLQSSLPTTCSITNPIDLIADATPERYKIALEAVYEDKNVDSVIVIFVPPIMTEELDVIKIIIESSKKYNKTTLACIVGRDIHSRPFMELSNNNIPVYTFPENCARTLSALFKYKLYKTRDEGELHPVSVDKPRIKNIIEKAKSEGRSNLNPEEVMTILRNYGFVTTKIYLSEDKNKILAHAKEVGYPLVLKLYSQNVIHKTDMGLVIMNIHDSTELENAISRIEEKAYIHSIKSYQLMIQAQINPGIEIIMGMFSEQKFGPIIMFGLGGIYTEILKDVSFKIPPITDIEARKMVQSIKSYPLLTGYRSKTEPVNERIIERYLMNLSQIVLDFPEIEQMDINPIIIHADSAKVVDARMTIRD